jgi:hypothetical protein
LLCLLAVSLVDVMLCKFGTHPVQQWDLANCPIEATPNETHYVGEEAMGVCQQEEDVAPKRQNINFLRDSGGSDRGVNVGDQTSVSEGVIVLLGDGGHRCDWDLRMRWVVSVEWRVEDDTLGIWDGESMEREGGAKFIC